MQDKISYAITQKRELSLSRRTAITLMMGQPSSFCLGRTSSFCLLSKLVHIISTGRHHHHKGRPSLCACSLSLQNDFNQIVSGLRNADVHRKGKNYIAWMASQALSQAWSWQKILLLRMEWKTWCVCTILVWISMRPRVVMSWNGKNYHSNYP